MENRFRDANEAFKYYKKHIIKNGVDFDDTKALFNVGFYIEKPMSNLIEDWERCWKWDYAEAEWQWYLSGNSNISKLGELYGKIPEIWKRMADKYGNVNSNYGWQWKRDDQLDNVIAMLKTNPKTRQAAISIYDAKEINRGYYQYDTPCTYAVQFTILNGYLNICVTMRSNDLWYGFCNDQYCFSKLQELVATEVGLPIGTYYHFAHNLHLYNNIIEKINDR
jgi:thymidylate synthase|tara:strand:+ start:613 stop:1278 length:666 start_codon:yes stop_codon:yes gene_type:complete